MSNTKKQNKTGRTYLFKGKVVSESECKKLKESNKKRKQTGASK